MLKLSQIWPGCTVQLSSCVLLKYLQQFFSSFWLFGTKCSRLTLYFPCSDLESVIFIQGSSEMFNVSFFIFHSKLVKSHLSFFVVLSLSINTSMAFFLVLISFSSQYCFYPGLLLELLNSLCYLCVSLSIAFSLFPRCHTCRCKK